MGNQKLTINLVTWNGAKYIPYLFDSLSKQTNKNWSLLVIDNNSTDDTVSLVEIHAPKLGVNFQIIKNNKNFGFAVGHNRAYKMNDAEYILIINQDLFLASDCVEKLVNFLDKNSDAAAVSPRTMRWNFEKNSFTNIIDSLGLKVYHNRRVVEINTCEIFQDNLVEPTRKVFGVSGAIAMFSRRAIEQSGYFFDGNFNSYKEDVDLAYRLNSLGWNSYVLLNVVAYHDRAGFGSKYKNDFFSVQNKQKQSFLVRYHSYKNHLVVLYKNEYWQNFFLDIPFIVWYELKKFVYCLLFDRAILVGLKEIKSLWKDLKKQRADMVKSRHVNWKEMRKKIYV